MNDRILSNDGKRKELLTVLMRRMRCARYELTIEHKDTMFELRERGFEFYFDDVLYMKFKFRNKTCSYTITKTHLNHAAINIIEFLSQRIMQEVFKEDE